MKARLYVLTVLAIMVCGCASFGISGSSNPPALFVEASGYGFNRRAALQDAFRNAIQKTYGVLITTQSRVDNDQLTKDVINEYSAAVITKYELLSENKDSDSGYTVKIAALVSSSKLLEFASTKTKIQGQSKAEGAQIYAQLSTALESKKQGDRLLQSLLTDYPTPALNAKLGLLGSRIDQERLVFLQVPYKITWNKSFLESLQQTVEYVSHKKCRAPTEDQYRCQYDVLFLSSNGLWTTRVGYKLADSVQSGAVRQLINPNVGLRVSFLDIAGRTIDTACLNINLSQNQKDRQLFFVGNNDYYFAPLVYEGGLYTAVGNYTLEGVMEVPVGNIQAINNIKNMSAVVTTQCGHSS